jgi:hypothetical protein
MAMIELLCMTGQTNLATKQKVIHEMNDDKLARKQSLEQSVNSLKESQQSIAEVLLRSPALESALELRNSVEQVLDLSMLSAL